MLMVLSVALILTGLLLRFISDRITDYSNPFVNGVITIQESLGGWDPMSRKIPFRRIDIVHGNRHNNIIGKLFCECLF